MHQMKVMFGASHASATALNPGHVKLSELEEESQPCGSLPSRLVDDGGGNDLLDEASLIFTSL